MTRSIDLYELQETDTAIDAAERRLEEIGQELEGEGDLAGLDEALAASETALAEAERGHHEADEAVVDLRAKLAELEETLYSGRVRSPRELKNLQEDVEAHQRQLAALENEALARMGRVQDLQASIAADREEREARVQERRRLVESLTSERASILISLEQLRSRRERQRERIDRSDLILYDRLRRARAGRAVAKVERGTCQGCRITLPTTVFQRARSGLKIVQCTSCERILYVV